MEVSRRLQVSLFASLVAALCLACDDSTPSPEALCARAAKCEQMDLLVSNESCAEQVESKVGRTSDCAKCVLSLPCSGMARLSSGQVSLSQLCGACPDTMAKASCAAGHQHLLICGIARAPASASASASGAKAASKASAAPSTSSTPVAASASVSAAKPTSPIVSPLASPPR